MLQRIAELRVKQKCRGLDNVQEQEWNLCLDWLVNKCYEAAYQENMSVLSSMTNNSDYLTENCFDDDQQI